MCASRQPTHARVDPSRWCITRRDLDDFEREVREMYKAGGIPDDPAHPNELHDHPQFGPSMYRVTECYIKPRTLASGTSWALMRNPEGLPCDVFVTHCWSEGVFEFIAKVRMLWPWNAKHLYCCFLSNPQNTDIGAMLGDDPMGSPFASALVRARYMLVIPNRRQSLYGRLWCVFEAHLALQCGLDTRMPRRPSAAMAARVLLPGCALFAVAFAVVPAARVDTQAAYGHGVHMIGLLGAIALEHLHYYLPSGGSWAALGMLGLLAGSEVSVLLHCRGDVPPELRVPIFDTALVVLSLTLNILRDIGSELVARAVALEGASCMTFDTVRSAQSSDPRDELRIREAIRGSEDEIDAAIRVLKSVGRYNPGVRANLARGFDEQRAREGCKLWLLLGGLYLWTVPLLEPLCLQGPEHMSPELTRLVLFAVYGALIVVVVCCMCLLGTSYRLEFAAYGVKACFAGAAIHHLAVGVGMLMRSCDPVVNLLLEDGHALNVSIYVLCAAGSAWASWRFYRRPIQPPSLLVSGRRMSSWTRAFSLGRRSSPSDFALDSLSSRGSTSSTRSRTNSSTGAFSPKDSQDGP